jgi:hypothetical protein
MTYAEGDFVFVQCAGYGYWPSKIAYRLENNHYDVVFYGDHLL